MIVATTPLEHEFNEILKQSRTATKEELPAICDKLRDCIRRGITIYQPSREGYCPPLLWCAIAGVYPLEIVECMYKEAPEAATFVMHDINGYNASETRHMSYKHYDLQLYLSNMYGYFFLDMTDDNIDTIEYFLACLKILNIKEKNFDWAISQKYGNDD